MASLIVVNPALAEMESQPLGEQAASALDALEKANAYTFKEGGIAVLIGSGTGNTVTADEIGNSFVKEIYRRGEKARYFYYSANWVGMSVEYHIGYSALGPWAVNEAAQNLGKAITRMEAARNIHGDTMKME